MKQILPLTIDELERLTKEQLVTRGKEIHSAKLERVSLLHSHPSSKEQLAAAHDLERFNSMLHEVITVLGFDPNRHESKL